MKSIKEITLRDMIAKDLLAAYISKNGNLENIISYGDYVFPKIIEITDLLIKRLEK